MHTKDRAIRATCLAVALSLAASVAAGSLFILLRARHNPMAQMSLDRVSQSPRGTPTTHPSPERDLLAEAARGERRRQAEQTLERRSSAGR